VKVNISRFIAHDYFVFTIPKTPPQGQPCREAVPSKNQALLSTRIGRLFNQHGRSATVEPLRNSVLPEESSLFSSDLIPRRNVLQSALHAATTRRIGQILKATTKSSPSTSLCNLAETIEASLSHVKPQEDFFFRAKIEGLSSFIVDTTNEQVYIPEKRAPGYPKKTFYKALNVLTLPFDSTKPPFYLTQRITKGGETADFSPFTAKDKMFQEINFISQFSSPLPQLHSFTYIDRFAGFQKDLVGFPVVSVIEGKSHSLQHKELRALNGAQLLQLSLGLMRKLLLQHEKGILHGNVRAESCFFILDKESNVLPMLINFDSCSFPKKGKLPTSLLRGHYEAIDSTPPEMLFQDGTKIDYFKVETFALGCVLYEVLFEKRPGWIATLQRFLSSGSCHRPYARATLCHEITHEIVIQRSQIASAMKNIPLELYEAVFGMLNPYPAVRSDLSTAIDTLKKAIRKKSETPPI
jgi:hypothetical protein